MHAGPCSWFAESYLLGPRRRTAFPSVPFGGGRKARRSNGRFRLNVSAGLWAGEEGGWRSLHHLGGLCYRRGLPAAGPLRHETVRRATGRCRRHVWPLAELGGRGPWQVFSQHPLFGPPQVSVLGAEVGGLGAGNWDGGAEPWAGSLGGVRAEVERGERCLGKAVWWLRARALESGPLGSNPDPVAPRCVTLGKSLSFLVSVSSSVK